MFSSLIVTLLSVLSFCFFTHSASIHHRSNGPFYGGFATYYYQNRTEGACGQLNPDSAIIGAMDQARFGLDGPESPLCGKRVKITNTNNNRTVEITIEDDCPTCDNANSIDLSVAAFQEIAALYEGIVPIVWEYI